MKGVWLARAALAFVLEVRAAACSLSENRRQVLRSDGARAIGWHGTDGWVSQQWSAYSVSAAQAFRNALVRRRWRGIIRLLRPYSARGGDGYRFHRRELGVAGLCDRRSRHGITASLARQ